MSLFFILFVTFVADELAPGDAATQIAGEKATQAQVDALRHKYGLDRPLLVRFGDYVVKAAQFDFGKSYYGKQESVGAIIKRTLPLTLMVATLAILLASIVGITLGTVAAIYQARGPDKTVLTLSTLGVTVPNFVLIPILVYIFSLQLDWLPQTWEANLRAPLPFYLILPVLVLAARPTATLTRLTRASMIDTMQQEFIRLAIAKGVPPWRLYVRHALRNAIMPVITAIGTSYGFLLTGSFITETAFTMPGLGMTGIDAIKQADTPVILGTVLVSGVLFVGINLLVDMLLPILDPRIREAQI